MWTKKQIKTIIRLYKLGKNCEQIGKNYNLSGETIRCLLEKNNIERRLYRNQRKHSVNISFFDKIDTEKKAYFLGFMYSDGNNTPKTNKFNIRLAEIDRSHLEKLRKIIGHSKPLDFINIKKKHPNYQNQYGLIINSKYMCQKLTELGCIANKSLVLKFPTKKQVPDRLIRHFLRGYFDGDGCICIKPSQRNNMSFQIVGCKTFCQELQKYLQKTLKIKIGLYSKHPGGNQFSVETGDQFTIKKIFNYFYCNESIKLNRKYNIFKKVHKTVEKKIKNYIRQSKKIKY